MSTTSFTPIASLAGGLLIGLAAAGWLVASGRIAGISGVVGSFVEAPEGPERRGSVAFLLGLLIGGAALRLLAPWVFGGSTGRSLPVVAVAGLLVGFGTRLGSGCTSGHGVCGIGRLSPRSMAATATFMFTGMVAAHAAGRWLGVG